MANTEDQWQRMIDGLRAGDPVVIEEFINRYGKSLQGVASQGIVTQMGRRFDASEVVQSVCRTFLRRAGGGEFELDDTESLWRLLCAITLTKVREKARYHLRQKRSIAAEVDLDSPAEGGDGGLAGRSAVDGTPGDDVEFADTFQHLIAGLDDEERTIVNMKLQQCSNEEIAERLQCSDRTVRRVLGRLLQRFEETLAGD